MPLIEPLESREVTKISEFVIVIDTSYSTNGPLVQKFLEETFQIIQERDSFFHKSRSELFNVTIRYTQIPLLRNRETFQNCSITLN